MEHAAALLALFALLELPQAAHSVWVFAFPAAPESRARVDSARALQGLLKQLILLGALAITWAEGWWSAGSVGLVPSAVAIPIGMLAWAVITAGRRLETRGRTGPPPDPATYVAGLRQFWPRERVGKAFTVATFALNGVTEELVTRGIFVHHLGEATGSVALAVAVGLAVNVALHAYQGRQHLPWHAGFYALTVALLYSPLGLLAAVALHVCADLAHADGRPTLAWVRASRRVSSA